MGAGRTARLGILGRETEVERVRGALDAAAAGSGRGLFITGEAGIGKTSLLRSMADDARGRFRIAMGQASALESDLPFAPLIRALDLRPDSADPAAAALGELIREPTTADPSLLRLQLVEGIAELVERWAAHQPVLVAIDDVHWADEATAQAVAQILQRLCDEPVVVAAAARPHPWPAALEALARAFADDHGGRLDLGPLSDEDLAELARCRTGSEPGAGLAAALRRSGGNPLYAEELISAAEQATPGDAGAPDLCEDGVPDSVRHAVLRDLSSLPASTLRVIRVASVLGTRFDLRHLALCVGRDEHQVVEALAPAMASRIVSGDGDDLAFRHDLVRDAVYEDQLPAVRAAGHRHAVERLRAAGLPVEAVVPHLLRGSWRSVPEAAGWLIEAARAMRGRHLPAAEQLFARALDVLGDDAPPDLRLDYADVLAARNRRAQLAVVLRPLLATPADLLTQDVRDRLVGFAGSPACAPSTVDARHFLDQLESAGLSSAGRARAMSIRAWTYWMEGRLGNAAELARRVEASDVGDPVLESQVQQILARHAEGTGDEVAKIDHARRALALARRAPGQPERAVSAAITLAIMLGVGLETADEAGCVVAEAAALARRSGLEQQQGLAEAVAALNADRRGRWDEASVRYDAAIRLLSSGGAGPAGWAQFHARAARLHLHRDELPSATERLAAAIEVVDDGRARREEPDELVYVHIAQAEIDAARGDRATALDTLRSLQAFIDMREIGVYDVVLLPAIATVAMAVDRRDHARFAIQRAERWMAAESRPDPTLAGVVPWCCALVDEDPEPFDDLIRWVDERSPIWNWQPLVREHAASALASAGRDGAAVDRLREAVRLWGAAGARRDVARLRAALRDLGVRTGRGGVADRPTTGWASLTDRESRIVELMEEGLIYREIGERLFISRRTVETHVAHVFRKLGVSSRRQLTELRRGGGATDCAPARR